ncbi:hypothetical protein SDRG_16337 [Saprolegnia diclina VS20]|uniref:Lysosomal dipeptide transporter MFSD1 n=1 Tax=Saprolegnia diclina (strain VS20) TaxID=1156394 RepID=T0R8K0_SAPDV|nr:hypothetical protein SDRG_16337 [Saprolegnia diclina VS20]EQC25822.1 hypothetical protein SDRG_16337 [Saprolegnia diclina VS20]|eukprot:XP_008620764.1 hypothetical protein SDRG_16337 [Saprolegnia diclina VS20]
MGSLTTRTAERSPLVEATFVVTRTSAWRFWSPFSPSHRFFLLVATCGVAFSGHFIRSGMAAVEQLMLDDPAHPISNTFYGALSSSASWPNLLLPFVGGHWLDRDGSRCLSYFVGLMILGHTIFTLAMAHHSYGLALAGRFVYGMGEGSVYVGARAFAATWFDTTEITCAMGIIVAMTNVARMAAKWTMAPIALYFGSYVYSFWYGDVMCLVSLACACIVIHATQRLQTLRATLTVEDIDPRLPWLTAYVSPRVAPLAHASKHGLLSRESLQLVGTLPRLFWLVLALQILYVQNFHWFQNISASYLYQVYGYSLVLSGVLASLSHVLVLASPILGLLLDRTHGRLHWVLASTVCGVVAFAWLLFTPYTPIVTLLLISLCLTVTPAVLVAALATSVPQERYGMAFGVLEVFEALAMTIGNVLVGYLRDVTGSYTADVYLFFGISWITLALGVALFLTGTSSQNVRACDDDHLGLELLPDKMSKA